MKIGVLLTYVGDISQLGFYNTQEIGLAKALSPLAQEVILYKAVPCAQQYCVERLEAFPNVTVHFLPTKQFGFHGRFHPAVLDTTLDVLVYFSDTQLAVPRVVRWAKANGVLLYPYIGVLESHSTNKLKKVVLDVICQRTLRAYKSCHCLAKTPAVAQTLQRLGVQDVTVAPVGLDVTLLNQDYAAADVMSLKAKHGYRPEDKVILFVGRLTAEKQPLRMLQLFKTLYQTDPSYRLLIVGKGELEQQLVEKIQAEQMVGVVTHLAQLPNADIWQLYRIADCFVNLNEQEIFGMAILEAMYYGCKVVAMHAPGPDFTIEDGVSGCLVQNDAQLIEAVRSVQIQPQAMHDSIVQHFTWQATASKLWQLINTK